MLNLAKEAGLQAGKVALSFFKRTHTFHHKGELANFATEADLACEKVIFDLVQKHFPQHSFLSEEMGMMKKDSEFTWVVDPIDGTVAFSHGWPLWGISLALFKGKQPILGVINLPVLQEIYYGEKGKGAFSNSKKIKVSKEDVLGKALVVTEYNYPKFRVQQKFPFEKFYRNFPSVVANTICTVLDLVYVASGKTEAMIEETPRIWDIAAGALLVVEAGGKVQDWQLKPIQWELNSEKHYNIIASNGILHQKISRELNSYLKLPSVSSSGLTGGSIQ